MGESSSTREAYQRLPSLETATLSGVLPPLVVPLGGLAWL